MEFDDGMVNEKLLTEHENELDDMLLTEENIMMEDDDGDYVIQSGEHTPNDDEDDFNVRDKIRQEVEDDCTAVHLPPADESEFKEDEDFDVV